MNRKNFLKKLGIGVGAAIVAPSMFIKAENTDFIDSESLKEVTFTPKKLSSQIKVSEEFWACTTCDCLTSQELDFIEKHYKKNV